MVLVRRSLLTEQGTSLDGQQRLEIQDEGPIVFDSHSQFSFVLQVQQAGLFIYKKDKFAFPE